MFDTAPNGSTIAEDTMRGPIELKSSQSPRVAMGHVDGILQRSLQWDNHSACSRPLRIPILAV